MFRSKDEVLSYLCSSKHNQKWFGEPAKFVDDELVIEYLCRTDDFNTCSHLLNDHIVGVYYTLKKNDKEFSLENIPYKYRTKLMYHDSIRKKGLSKEIKIIIDLLYKGSTLKDVCQKYDELPSNITELLKSFEENDIAYTIDYNLQMLEIDFWENIDNDVETLMNIIGKLDLSWDVLSNEDKLKFAVESGKLVNSVSDIYEYVVGNNLKQYYDIVSFCDKYLGFKFEHNVIWLKEFDIKKYFGIKRGKTTISIKKLNSNGEIVNISYDAVSEILDLLNQNKIPTYSIIVEKAIASYIDNQLDHFIDSMKPQKAKSLDYFDNLWF